MTTLNDVRATLIEQGYPADQVDAMLNLAGRMVLEGSLASKDDLAALRDEFTASKIDVSTQFADLRADMDVKFADLRADMDVKFAEMRTEMNTKFAEMDVKFADLRTEMNVKFAEQIAAADERERRTVKWVVGTVIAGIAVNVAVMGIGIGVVALLIR